MILRPERRREKSRNQSQSFQILRKRNPKRRKRKTRRRTRRRRETRRRLEMTMILRPESSTMILATTLKLLLLLLLLNHKLLKISLLPLLQERPTPTAILALMLLERRPPHPTQTQDLETLMLLELQRRQPRAVHLTLVQ